MTHAIDSVSHEIQPVQAGIPGSACYPCDDVIEVTTAFLSGWRSCRWLQVPPAVDRSFAVPSRDEISLNAKEYAMLVLSRKPGERIMIGDNVVVTVVRIGPNNVRLGIDAPAELNIVREELCGQSAMQSTDEAGRSSFPVRTGQHTRL